MQIQKFSVFANIYTDIFLIDLVKMNNIINKLLTYSGLNAKIFSEKLGLDRPQAIYDLQKGKTKNISPSMKDKIISVFPEINASWLLTGEGEMLRENANTLPSASTKEDKVSALNTMLDKIQQKGKYSDRIRFIPLLNIDAVGGSDNDVMDSGEYVEDLIPVKGAKESSICIPVSGDSMMPIFNPGDYVVIDEVVEWNLFLEMGQYYVVALKDNRRLIKKVTYSEIDKNSNFLLVSVNENYPPVELPKTLIRRMFIVTQKHQKLTL